MLKKTKKTMESVVVGCSSNNTTMLQIKLHNMSNQKTSNESEFRIQNSTYQGMVDYNSPHCIQSFLEV
jgi:hypothetical protein